MAKEEKTSKTARVMNLLSKKQDNAPAEAAPESQAPAEGPAPTQVPSLLSSIGSDAAVSGQIKDALENALEDALEVEAAPAPAPQAFVPPAPQPEPQPTVPQPEPESTMPATFSVPEPSSPGYVNVMQVLVEEKAPKYVKMFGLCDCERCLEDVKALALNHLPPKYVVMDKGDMIPKLTFYEGKYSSDITAQLLQACKVVMKTPHHSR